jgi:hypothetical protein
MALPGNKVLAELQENGTKVLERLISIRVNTSALCTSLPMQASPTVRYVNAGLKPAGSLPMLRTCSCNIASIVMVTFGLVTAQAADTTLTLACKGTQFDHIEGKAQPPLDLIPFGVVANLTARTLEGFPIADPFPVKITVANQATIQFEGSETIAKAS